jgi:hypothetical protein
MENWLDKETVDQTGWRSEGEQLVEIHRCHHEVLLVYSMDVTHTVLDARVNREMAKEAKEQKIFQRYF